MSSRRQGDRRHRGLLQAIRREVLRARQSRESVCVESLRQRFPEISTDSQLLSRVWDLLAELRPPASQEIGGRDPEAFASQAPLPAEIHRAALGYPSPSSEARVSLSAGAVCPGCRLGDFSILRELGRGAMGTVYLAEQVSLRRRVAVKVLSLELGWNDELLRRFEREVAAAARIAHPNVAQVFTSGWEGRVPFYAMEYIEGCTLAERLRERLALLPPPRPAAPRKGDPTRSRDAATLRGFPDALTSWQRHCEEFAGSIAQAARGLHACHEEGVIHRDVKPSNLAIARDGTVKVIDFGLAHIAGDATLTRRGAVLGTPLYASPELLLPRRRTDRRSDVFSLGTVLYEALSAKVPWDGEDLPAASYQIVHVEP